MICIGSTGVVRMTFCFCHDRMTMDQICEVVDPGVSDSDTYNDPMIQEIVSRRAPEFLRNLCATPRCAPPAESCLQRRGRVAILAQGKFKLLNVVIGRSLLNTNSLAVETSP